ncbi:MAG: helix-turn-helix domain-containing protein, partial [Hyphomicrobium sp.]
RATLHAAIIGGLHGDERFASLLAEFGLRLGATGLSGVSFDSPMSRTDIADYLALNADTLSRITSRFKARGLLAHARGGHTMLPDWTALCAATPVSGALQSLHTPRSV